MNSTDNDLPPTVPDLASDRPYTPTSHFVWRIAALLVGSTAAIALLGEIAKLLVGSES